jgi:uncharacterized membrane protein SirB2
MYFALKHLHVTMVALSGGLFVLRGLWMFAESPQLQQRWVRIVPHVIDTLLLASAIALTILIQQYPLVNGWLTAKVLALVIYIGLGTLALKRGKTKTIRTTAWLAALLTFGYMVAVAVHHSPWPFPG